MIAAFLSRWRKPSINDAARMMAKAGHDKQRAKVRATCDDMRARMGLPKAEWPN